jgi:hypothetical protein
MRTTLPIGLIFLLILMGLVACQAVKTEIVEVTKEVVVTKEVPVEVTKEVIVTQEVPVEVEKIVEVTPVPAWELAAQYLPGSLHGTTAGMGYFYAKENGGMENLTGIPYAELPCKNCHTLYNKAEGLVGQNRCESCHINEKYAPVQAAVNLPGFPADGRGYGCLSCHRRQGFEYTKTTVVLDENGQPVLDPVKGIPYEVPAIVDVHRSPSPNGKGLACVNCHGAEQTHGDGNTYNNLFDSPNTQCSDCHKVEALSQTPGHTLHGENITCAACHAQTVVSCQGCHLNEVVAGGPEFPNQRVFGWKFLVVNNESKIDLGNIMTAMWTTEAGEVKTFAAISPYYDHSIGVPRTAEQKRAVCLSCHDSAAVKSYNETGQIVIAKWDEAAGKMVYPTKGVVPVPADYQTAFQVAFPVIDNIDEVVAAAKEGKPSAEVEKLTRWIFGKDGVDLWQMNYAKPLEEMPPALDPALLDSLYPLPTPAPSP